MALDASPAADDRRRVSAKREAIIRIGSTLGPLVTHLSLSVAAIIWGANFAAVRVMLDEVTPLDVVFFRLVGAAILFLLLLIVTESRVPVICRRDVVALAVLGVLGVVVPNVAIVCMGRRWCRRRWRASIVTSNPIPPL